MSSINIFHGQVEKTSHVFFKFAGKHALVMILLVVLLNLALKSWNIGAASLWCDEGLSAQYSQMGIKEILYVHKNDSNPPLYACVLSAWETVFGNSETGLRSFSVVLSLFTAVMLYVFAARHLNIQAAVCVSLLFAFSDIHLYYSHEMRTYALTVGLCAASVFLFYELFKGPNLPRLVALGVVNALLIHSHYITVFFFAFECIASVFFYFTFKKGFRFYFLSQVLTAVLALPWFLFVKLSGYPAKGDISWLSRPVLSDVIDVLADFANGKFLLLVYLIVMLASSMFLMHGKNKTRPAERLNITFLLLFAFFPVLADFAMSFIQPVFNVRYVLYASLGFFLLMAYLLSLAPWKASLKLAVIGCIVVVSCFRLHLSPGKGEDWNRAVPYIKAMKTDCDLVIVSAEYLYPCFAYYYNRDYFKDYAHTLDRIKAENVYCMNDASGLTRMDFKGLDKIILLQGHQAIADPKNTLYNAFNEKFRLESSTNFAGLKLSVFSNRSLD